MRTSYARLHVFTAVGLGLGIASAGIWWLAAWAWPPVLAALAAVAALLMMTGALHEDGLADTFDGLGSGRPTERALEIMRDSRLAASAPSPSASYWPRGWRRWPRSGWARRSR